MIQKYFSFGCKILRLLTHLMNICRQPVSELSFKEMFVCFHLGLDFVYIMNVEKNTVRVFGGSGKDGGLFSDPAGITVDNKGNMIVADSRNHKLKVETKDN